MSQGKQKSRKKKTGPDTPGYKLFYTESDRPVFINPKTGEFTLTCAGFPPIPMKLSNVYAVFRENAGSTSKGVKAELYDGNGHRIRIVFDFTDAWVCSKMSERLGNTFGWTFWPGCKSQVHNPKDSKNKSYIIEMEYCAKHLEEFITKHGPVIPTTRDLTPPSKEVSIDLPADHDLNAVKKMIAKLALNPEDHPVFRECNVFREEDLPPMEKPFRKSCKEKKKDQCEGKKDKEIPELEMMYDELSVWHDVE